MTAFCGKGSRPTGSASAAILQTHQFRNRLDDVKAHAVAMFNPVTEIPIEEEIQAILDEYRSQHTAPVLLEAGCGSTNTFELDGYRVVGIDISAKQLERNTELDERLLGDIQDYAFERNAFDVIVCWNVLEHVSAPVRALENFARALKDGGLLIMEAPNPISLKGLVTKFSPHAVHVLFYRYIRNMPDAGKADTAPFKTYLRFSLTPGGLRRFANANGLEVVHIRTYAAFWTSSGKMKFVNAALKIAVLPIRLCTLMKYNPLRVQCNAVFRKRLG